MAVFNFIPHASWLYHNILSSRYAAYQQSPLGSLAVQCDGCIDKLPCVTTDADADAEKTDTFVLCLLKAHVAQKPTQGSSLLYV